MTNLWICPECNKTNNFIYTKCTKNEIRGREMHVCQCSPRFYWCVFYLQGYTKAYLKYANPWIPIEDGCKMPIGMHAVTYEHNSAFENRVNYAYWDDKCEIWRAYNGLAFNVSHGEVIAYQERPEPYKEE